MKFPFFVLTSLLSLLLVSVSSAQQKFEQWPVELTIGGRIVVCCSNAPDENQKQILASIFDEKQSLILSSGQTKPKWLHKFFFETDDDKVLKEEERKAWTEKTLQLDAVDSDSLAGKLKDKKFLGLLSARPLTNEQYERLLSCSIVIKKWVKEGGTLLVNGSVVPILGKKVGVNLSDGSDLIPGTFIVNDLDNKKRTEIGSVVKDQRPLVGIGLSSDAILVLSGRKVMVPHGAAEFFLPEHNKYLQSKNVKVVPRSGRRDGRSRTGKAVSLLDLTQWRRMALDRSLPQFPADFPKKPFVKNGTLVIVGGGGMPRGLIQEIVDLAGGNEKAKMVFVPCSERETVRPRQGMVRLWRQMGIKSAHQIHTKDRMKADTDKKFLEPLQNATGIWFGGGRQWNFSDSYYGTEAHRLMKKVLDRGGVIGGSSAGASIQGNYLARATPIGNVSIMAPGYERGGLGFLTGVAIDQHFSQRRRQKDMTSLVKRYPQLLGIGIDEATAIIVKKSKAKIVGRGRVFFYDSKSKINDEGKDYVSLPKGSVYDLAKRKIIVDSRIAELLEKVK